MNWHPIIFTGESIPQILAGDKTQTRRAMKTQPPDGATEVRVEWVYGELVATYRAFPDGGSARSGICACPYGVPGDRLWVQETWRPVPPWETRRETVQYRADGAYLLRTGWPESFRIKLGRDRRGKWRPSIHMPRWASRISLEVTQVRAQRLQDISKADAKAEGVAAWFPTSPTVTQLVGPGYRGSYRNGFHARWDALNRKHGHGWDLNEWVFATTFKLLKDNNNG